MTRYSAVVSLMLLIAAAPLALGQHTLRRFELGTQTTMLRSLGKTDVCAACPRAYWSAGPAVTVNLNRYFAIDSAFTLFPGPADNPSWFVGGHVSEVLVGIKAGVHGRRFSLFTKARPGYVRWSHGIINNIQFPDMTTVIKDGVAYTDLGQPVYSYKARTNLAIDLGGGIEYAATSNIILRAEMGDTIIRWHHSELPSDPPILGSRVSNNFQISSGVFYRFGAPIPVEYRTPEASHRFFDKTNIALFSASLLSQTADAITTQRFMSNCNIPDISGPLGQIYNCAQREKNPLARPFVKHGWGGQIALAGIVNTAQMSVAYSLHRMGHHRIERFVTIPLTIGGAYFAYKNLQR